MQVILIGSMLLMLSTTVRAGWRTDGAPVTEQAPLTALVKSDTVASQHAKALFHKSESREQLALFAQQNECGHFFVHDGRVEQFVASVLHGDTRSQTWQLTPTKGALYTACVTVDVNEQVTIEAVCTTVAIAPATTVVRQVNTFGFILCYD